MAGAGRRRAIFKTGGLNLEQKIPAVSVIIPMYNAEKFIVPCLESLFAQTFRDFEIVVVDDCSTDKSCDIVESYVQKFTGVGIGLRLLRSKKNFGNPGVPRNRGLNASRGKYVYFMDNDDLLLSHALDELYTFAENYSADVVCMHKYFEAAVEFKDFQLKNLKLKQTIIQGEPCEDPVLESSNLADRMSDFLRGKIFLMPWLQFLRRDFLIDNDVYFPQILVSEDDFWIVKVICRAEKILCVPSALYVNRNNPSSLTREKKSVQHKIKYHMTPTIDGMKFMSEIFNETKFFQQNPNYWYAWINRIVGYGFSCILQPSLNLSPYEVYEIFREQFAQETGEHAELISYLCSLVNTQQKMLVMANGRITELEKKLAER